MRIKITMKGMIETSVGTGTCPFLTPSLLCEANKQKCVGLECLTCPLRAFNEITVSVH
jgi:hypothetical protein